jgi:hypothetical protein
MTRPIYCCGCDAVVDARLTDGSEVYPHRPDLAALPLWKCDSCGNWVGCHHRRKESRRGKEGRTAPLGDIATPGIRAVRRTIHAAIDRLLSGERPLGRTQLYRLLSARLGLEEYHTGNIRTLSEGERVMSELEKMACEYPHSTCPTTGP